MLEINKLQLLISEKLVDSEVLFRNHRTLTAVYLAGYAIELALKLKIAKQFNFNAGFPENRSEFNVYLNTDNSRERLKDVITEIRQIKNHDLKKLLQFSGLEVQIKKNKLDSWSFVSSWDPSLRYQLGTKSQEEADRFWRNTKEILTLF